MIGVMAVSQSETATADGASAVEESSAETANDVATTEVVSEEAEAVEDTVTTSSAPDTAADDVAPTPTTTSIAPGTTTTSTTSTSTTSTTAPSSSTTSSTTSTTSTTTTTAAPAAPTIAPTPVAVAPVTEVFEDQGHPGNVVSFDGSFLRLDDYSRRTVLVERSDNGADWTEAVTVGIPRDARVQDLQANSTGLVAIVEVPREVDFVDPFEVMTQLGLIDEDQLNNICQSPFQGVGQPIVVSVCDFEALYEAEQAFWEAIDVEDIDEEELRRLEDEFVALQDMLLQGEEVLRLEPGDAGFDEVADAFLAERAFFEMPYDRLVATSTDGTNWVTNGVADIELDEGDFQYVAGLAISDGRAVVLVAVEPGYFDPATLLFENGLINEDQLINTCLLYTSPSPRDS